MKTCHIAMLAAVAFAVAAVPVLSAHCDTLDGPVVETARAALSQGDVTPVLKWVRDNDEAAVRAAFAQTLAVRRLSPAAEELADRYFFETLVRIHRTGEGEPYTGLQPAGSADPALVAADHAIEQGNSDRLVADVATLLQERLHAGFQQVLKRKAHMNDSVAAGREYIEAYVEFIHLYERLEAEASPSPKAHGAHGH